MSSNRHNGMDEQLKSALAEALQTGDFANLNELVSLTVTDALSDAGKHLSQNVNININNPPKTPKKQSPPKPAEPAPVQPKTQLPQQSTKMPPVPFKEVGSILVLCWGNCVFG